MVCLTSQILRFGNVYVKFTQCISEFTNQRKFNESLTSSVTYFSSFSGRWWLTLGLTGLSLGCVLSVKFVGVFVLAVVGLYTIADLWTIFCDVNQPLVSVSDLTRSVGGFQSPWDPRQTFGEPCDLR